MKNFKLTPQWVLNNLPLGYGIFDDQLAVSTDTELDFVLIKQALQTLKIQYYENNFPFEGIPTYTVMIQVDDVSQILNQQLEELKHDNLIIRRELVQLPETRDVLSALCILTYGLLPIVCKINNESLHIDEILSSLSELLASKCKFHIGSDGLLHYIFKDQSDESSDSEEHELLLMIGEFAFYKINLKYLELKNPNWRGLNKTLSKAFPEIFSAYISLSKKFGFTITARLVDDPCISKKKFRKYLRKAEVENWDSDLLELDEDYLEEEEVKQSTSNVNERNGFLPRIQKQKSFNCKAESHSFSVN